MPNIVALRLLARAMYAANHEIRAEKKQGIEPDFERAVQYLRSAVEAPDFIPALMRIEGILHEPEKKLDPYDVTPKEDDIIVEGGGEWLDEEFGDNDGRDDEWDDEDEDDEDGEDSDGDYPSASRIAAKDEDGLPGLSPAALIVPDDDEDAEVLVEDMPENGLVPDDKEEVVADACTGR
jgi:hypothetical protein